MWDGGKSENLAALSLIERGVKKIIIVDAEHDPNYKFGAYLILRKMLKDKNIKLYVGDIENFIKSPQKNKKGKRLFSAASVSYGKAISISSKGDAKAKLATAESGKEALIDSDIYYIKMSRPKDVFSEKLTDTVANERGEKLNCDREALLTGNKKACEKIKGEINNYDCKKAAGISFDKDMFVYGINQYLEFIDHPKFWSGVNFMNTMGKVFPDFTYDFPQTTTFDQSFYRDQLEAFVGLGYLQAEHLKKSSDLLEISK